MILTKLHRALFFSLVFWLPVNLAKHFLLPTSYVRGVLVDYLAPALYVTDLLLIGLLGLWLTAKLSSGRLRGRPGLSRLKVKLNPAELSFWSGGLLAIGLVSVTAAANRPAAVYQLLRLSLGVGLVVYTRDLLTDFRKLSTLTTFWAAGVITQAVWGLAQFFNQRSLFDNYLIFGEIPYRPDTFGIAKVSFAGRALTPPYGTFPHPNLLAGFLVIGLLLVGYQLKVAGSVSKHSRRRRFLQTTQVLGLAALTATFSQAAWLAFLVGGCFLVWRPRRSQAGRRVVFLTVLTGLIWVGGAVLGGRWADSIGWLNAPSFSRRRFLAQIAGRMIGASPWRGVGLNNFTVRMADFAGHLTWPYFLQPPHHLFLLVTAETGILGGLFLLGGLVQLYRRLLTGWSGSSGNPASGRSVEDRCRLGLGLLAALTILGSFDHYLLTIPPGQLLTWLTLGVVASTIKRR